MKKRLLALLVVLALLLTCIPTGVVAEGTDQGQLLAEGQEETTEATTEAETTQAVVTQEPHSHDDDAHKCEHCDQLVTWTKWGDDPAEKTTLPNGQGHYVLVDTIHVGSSVTTTDNADIVLCLNGHTINGGNSKYFYRVGSKTNDTSSLTISDCNHEAGQLINGYHGDTSGAIYVRYNARFYMYAGKFVNNTNAQSSALTGYSGGAIQVRNTAQAVIKNVEFSGNSTTAEGGAICIRQSGQVTLENVVLKDNTADRLGGAIFLDSADCQLTVKNCTFKNNQAEQSGGAIYVQDGTVSIKNSIFTQNGAEADGGAIHAPHAKNVTITGSTFEGNTAGGSGGALYVTGAKTVTAENCIFKANTATGNGGAVFVTGADAVFEAKNCTFGGENATDGNTATGNGGAISSTEGSTITITGGALKNNQATDRGGAIYTNKSNVTVTGTASEYVLFEKNHGQGSSNGGGVFATGNCDVRLQYVEMTGNTLGGSGGSAVFVTGGARGYIADSTITGNSNEKIDAYRGAVYVGGTTSVLTLSGKVIIKDNAAGNLYVQNNNYNRTNDDCWVVVDGLTEGSEITLNTYTSVAEDEERLNDRILDGQPENWTKGWIKYNYLPVDYNKDEDKFFIGTSTHIHCACGAHLAADADGCTHETIPGCDHSEITYEPWGDPTSLPTSGTIYLETNVTLAQNVAVNGDLKICLNRHTISVDYEEQGNTKDRLFTLNNADTLTISDCTARMEGGVYTAGKLTGSSYTAVMVANNTGTDADGNEIVNSVVINFFDGIFTGNTSSAGAAFSVQDGATLNMYGGEISGNHSTKTGGAIYVGAQANLNIYGGTITGNTAETKGTVYVTASNLAIYGGTITGNTAAEGAGVYLNNSSLTLGGTPEILGNTADGASSNLYLAGTSQITFDQLGAGKGKIAVSADEVPRYLSADMGENNYLAYFITDGADRKLRINNNRLYLVVASDHAHCGCADGTSEYCDHVQEEFAPWEDPTSLPTSGAIYLKTNVALPANVAVNGDLKICLNGFSISAEHEEQGSSKDRLFTLNGADTLSISDCTAKTVDGVYTAGKLTGSSYTAVMIANSATSDNTAVVNFYDGIFTGNESTTGAAFSIQDGATLNMYGGEISGNIAKLATDSEGNTSAGNGGAVYVGTKATFNMYGGTITGNTTEDSGTVYVTATSKLNMYGGTITGNRAAKNAGGVLLNGSATVMTMQGGEISNNVAGGAAGGVLAQVRATLNLKGGKIADNTAKTGGAGVFISTNSAMNMDGGAITGNETEAYGGGIYAYGSSFTMTGGEISGNTAANGAGIAGRLGERTVDGEKLRDVPATVAIQDGAITGNTATSTGGGVFLNGDGVVMTLSGGEISGNTALNGGGLITQTGAAATVTGGKISENTAPKGGAGVYVAYTTSFTMEGGEITGNTTETNGGGLYVLGSTAQFLGGKISGNTAANGAGTYINSYTKKATETTKEIVYIAQVKLADVSVSGNTGSGVYVRPDAAEITLEGDTVITDNTAGNLYLCGDTTVTIGALGEKANVGIRADINKLPRQVSANKAALKGLTSDNKYRPLVLIDGYVYIGYADGHVHCDCGGSDANCDHTENAWAAWDDPTSLPTGDGYYYLITDVSLTSYASFSTGHLRLCLNGHTVTANGEEGTKYDRIFSVQKDAKLTISDCTASYAEDGTYTAGKLTGATGSAIMILNQTAEGAVNNVTVNLYDGIVTGNSVTGTGGVILVQDEAIFNMYGGEISKNAGKILTDENDKQTGGMGSAFYVGSSGVLNVYGGTIAANTAEDSGTVYVTGSSKLNMYGGAITGNTVQKNGGAVMVNGRESVMTMTGGTICGNTAGSNAGGVLIQAGATFNLAGGQITGNVAKNGGGIFISSSSFMNMTGGEIIGNTATGIGAGIYLYGAAFIMEDGLIADNTAANGGALYARLGQRTVDGTKVNDVESAVTMNGGTISANKAEKVGGGVFIHGDGTTFTMNGGQITGNAAANGGGVITQTGAVFNLAGGKIAENTATKGGSGIYVSYTSVLNQSGGAISDNKTEGNGGGIYALGSQLNLTGGKVSNNYAKGSGAGIYGNKYTRFTGTPKEITYTSEINVDGAEITKNTTPGNGAGICTSKGAVVNMISGTVSNNTATKSAGGMLLQSGSKLNLSGGTVSNNTARNCGGVYISTDSYINMTGGSISNNTSTNNGAGLYLLKCEAVLAGGTISGNTTEKTAGGIYMVGAQATLSGTNVTNNIAKTNGAGICTTKRTVNGVDYYTNIVMTGGTVSGNKTEGSGGGMLLQSYTTMTMRGGVVENNRAGKDGAGIYVSTNCTFHMDGGEVRYNTADRNGGGLYNLKATVNYNSGKIHHNTAVGNGGGVVMSGEGYVVNMKQGMVITENASVNGGAIVVQGKVTLNMENVDLTNNTASTGNGGAIYLSTNSFLNVTGGSITNHSCEGYGGALFSTTNSTLNMNGTTISGNKAGYGGALSLGGTANIENVTISDNEATEEGGGVYCHKLLVGGLFQNHQITMKNSAIENNKAGAQGGGIYVRRGSKCVFDGLTVTGNTSGAEGGGLYVVDDTNMYNMTVTGNTSGGEGYALYLADSEYDGESYFIGIFKLGGVMKVNGNTGGDMYFGNQTAAAVDHMGLTGDTLMNIRLHSGYLTQVLQGVYNYEGGNLEYVVTAGDRSLKEPEYDAAYNDQFKPEEPTEEPTGEGTEDQTEKSGVSPVVWIASGAGAVVIAAVIAIIAALGKKKKSAAGK